MKTLTYTAPCSRSTHRQGRAFLDPQRRRWKAALEQHLTAYKRQGVRGRTDDQAKEWTERRQSDPAFAQDSVHCQRSALTRLDQAFQAFFGRVKQGNTPGFPRFKGRHRAIRSFDFPMPSFQQVNRRQGLIVNSIGNCRFRGEARSHIK